MEEEDTQNNNYFKDQQVKALAKNKKSSSKSNIGAIPPKTRHVYINFNRYSVLCTGIAVVIVILIYLICNYENSFFISNNRII